MNLSKFKNYNFDKYDEYLSNSYDFIKKLKSQKKDKISHLEPPFNNLCQLNCNKRAAYIKNGYYCCWFHIWNI